MIDLRSGQFSRTCGGIISGVALEQQGYILCPVRFKRNSWIRAV